MNHYLNYSIKLGQRSTNSADTAKRLSNLSNLGERAARPFMFANETAGGPKPARHAHQPLRTGRYSFETMWIGISSVSETCVSGSSPSGWQNSISSFASG